jgi:hypothetical protein
MVSFEDSRSVGVDDKLDKGKRRAVLAIENLFF